MVQSVFQINQTQMPLQATAMAYRAAAGRFSWPWRSVHHRPRSWICGRKDVKRRSHSSWPWGEDQEFEASPLGKRLNQVYEEYRSQKLAPSWLPLHPNASYWMPPSPPLTDMLKLSAYRGRQLSQDQIMSLLTSSCWPCSHTNQNDSHTPAPQEPEHDLQEESSISKVKEDKSKD